MDEAPYTWRQTLKTPTPISCLAKGLSDYFFAGSDGSVRVYNQETLKVVKAIRGLGEVSSVVCMLHNASDLGDVWVASDRHVRLEKPLRFTMDTEKMILGKADAILTLELGADDDMLNELSPNHKNSQLAFCLDSGAVGVVDLSTKQITYMKTSARLLMVMQICGTVKFIPDRPSELVSGGYDYRLLHHDFHQRTVFLTFGRFGCYSSFNISYVRDVASVRVFRCFNVSTIHIIICHVAIWYLAAGIADGRQDEAFMADVGHGPITALYVFVTAVLRHPNLNINRTFIGPRTLCTSTLMGKVSLHEIGGPTADGKLDISPKWTKATTDVSKVNAIIATGSLIIIGGLSERGEGMIEVWENGSKSGDV
ncbi:hypothetical protein BD769DRAFT_1532033 [Suillus cothurnatus]|nr:hypothetical protein BD769DRAFT_1532033 [Suillus cothurnatus]